MNNLFYFILATTEQASHASHHSESFLEVLASSNIINIIIVAGLFYFLIKKYNLFSGVDLAQKKIIEDLQNAEKNKQLAVEKLENARQKLQNAKQEADTIIAEAEKVAIAMKEDIIESAHKEAEKIVLQAKKAMESEKQFIINEVQKNVTSAALEVAKDNIKASLDDNWQRKLIQDFVNDLQSIKAN